MNTPCFGLYWDGTSGSKCTDKKGCRRFDSCLDSFARETLVDYQVELGRGADPVELGEKAHVPKGAIVMALKYQRDNKIDPYESVPEPTPPPPPPPKPKKKVPPKQRGKNWKWSKEHNLKRWLRERERNRAIDLLKPGMKLKRLWNDRMTETVVEYGYYLYNGEKYPTLQSVTNEIVGMKPRPKQKRKDGTRPRGVRMVCSYSAVRFFGLLELFGLKKRKGK